MAANTKTLADIAVEMGLDPANARVIPIDVKIENFEGDIPSAAIARLAADGMETATSPITESGKPRILKISAWIAHSGAANLNSDAFLAEDLQEVATKGLFAPPYLGMVDFNHDFNPYGAWYSARYEFDPIANEYGLLAEGMLFAWRFEELADKLVAEQVRSGSIPVSMACIARNIETRDNPLTGATEYVLRKPVFLAVSVLDVPPADPNARAIGFENEGSTEQERIQLLNQAQIMEIHASDGVTLNRWAEIAQATIATTGNHDIPQEDTMDLDKIIAALTEALGEKAEAIVAQMSDTFIEAAKVPTLESRVAELTSRVEEITAKLDNVSGELETTKVALEAKIAELTELQVAHEALTTAHNEIVTEVEEAHKAAVREHRLEQLPEFYLQVLDARGEEGKEKAIGHLVEMSDAEFEEHLEVVTAGSNSEISYEGRTAREGSLATPAGKSGRGLAIDEFVRS